ncbi:hypothetical protein TNCV_2581391 [Trichonephila clavipes]|nr:hypothetical protein TNCV_2581391 [Trichonephila clavipes]
METFRKCKQACVDALKQMPDHYPEEPFFVRALTELQEIEETISMAQVDTVNPKVQTQNNSYGRGRIVRTSEYPPNRKTARKINLESPDKEGDYHISNKFNIPKELLPNNVENPGSTTDERNLQLTKE